jgi:hypothetical protein
VKRIGEVFACAILALAFVVSVPLYASAHERLRPALAPFQFMLGSWRCTSWVAATNQGAPRVDAITARYSVVGGGTGLDQDVVGPSYRSFAVFGYEASSKRIVTAAYANDGSYAHASSQGWAGNAITLNGSYQRGASGVDLRDILVKFTERRFTDTTEIRERGRWKTVANSDCSKR